jgi:hypothetical protein
MSLSLKDVMPYFVGALLLWAFVHCIVSSRKKKDTRQDAQKKNNAA